jgi:hypothetical protein
MVNRREFIQTFAQTSLVGVVALTPSSKLLLKKYPYQIEFNGKLLKWSDDGQILSSSDMGLNWETSINLGAEYQIQELYQRHHYAYARLSYKGKKFALRSIDGAVWLA